jgi:hypothetical protein
VRTGRHGLNVSPFPPAARRFGKSHRFRF